MSIEMAVTLEALGRSCRPLDGRRSGFIARRLQDSVVVESACRAGLKVRGNSRKTLGRVFPDEFELDVLVDQFEPRLTPRIPLIGE